LIGIAGGDSCGKSMSLETPQEVIFFQGGSSHARGKRPPAMEINGFCCTLPDWSAITILH
jgi:hypothetical protein